MKVVNENIYGLRLGQMGRSHSGQDRGLNRVRARRDVRGAISGSLGAKIEFSGAASNIALTSPSSWKEFNISKVASDDGLSFELSSS